MNNHQIYHYFHILPILLLLYLAGCSSNIPKNIESKPVTDITYKNVKEKPEAYLGQSVRWGGKIIEVVNKDQYSEVEILSSPLDSFGEPLDARDYSGRFLAKIEGFIDPEYYTKGRRITVFGTVASKVAGNIGEHEYQYPFVDVVEHHLWPKRSAFARNRYYPDLLYPGFFHPTFYRFPHRYPYYLDPYYRHRLRFGSGLYLPRW